MLLTSKVTPGKTNMRIKSENKSSKRLGYNFSAITKDQHSMFRKLDKKYEPDLIYTTGKYTKKFFEKTNIPVKKFCWVQTDILRN